MGMTKKKRQNGFVLAIALVPVIATAQQFLPATPGPPPDPNTRYEVVAIKAVNGASGQMMMRMLPGRLDYNGMPIGILLRQALQKPDYQIVGAPGWVNTERYSITATAPEGTPPTAMTVMMLNLLKDRFHLTSHLETREQPIFNLVIARSDGRLGPDLKPTPPECQATIAERIAASKAAAGRGAPPPFPTSFPDPNACGFVRMGPGLAAGSGRTIAHIAPTLADLLGRPVIDKTGLTGLYDFALKFAPTGRGAGPFAMLPGPPPPPDDPDAPGLSTAVQEQLGLKLESARGPVEVVVIDTIEKPTLD